jgi:hypothetical protein
MLLDGPAGRDHVKVLDFGLARSLSDPDSRLTGTGIIAGTPRYLAPEVLFDGSASTPAQDLYALGVMFGELACGKPIWEAPTLEALLTIKATTKPELAGVPGPLRVLITNLLATEPTARPSARAVRADLEEMARASASEPALIPIALDATRELSTTPHASPSAIAAIPDAPSSLLVPEPSEPVSAAFAPPAKKALALDLDPAWEQERAVRVAAASPPVQPAPAKRGVVTIAVFVLVAGAAIGGGAWYVTKRSNSAPATPPSERAVPATPGSVTVKIRASAKVAITFDGHAIGTAPLTMQVPKSNKAVLIQAHEDGGVITKQVVLDSDQTVEFP